MKNHVKRYEKQITLIELTKICPRICFILCLAIYSKPNLLEDILKDLNLKSLQGILLSQKNKLFLSLFVRYVRIICLVKKILQSSESQ